MWNLKFAKIFDNNIFTKYGVKPIVEDYYNIKKNTFCVADGVTRDDINGNSVPYPKTEQEVKKWIELYPNPSGAYKSAKITADKFIELVKKEDNIDKNKMLEIVKKINTEIWKINEGRKIDYLKEDLYCCVAVGGIIKDNILYCFSIGDCHINIFDDKMESIFETINNHKNFEDYLYNKYIKENEYDWEKSECRKMVRKEFRNNPNKKINGKDVSFGVLSGEKEAENYINVYEVDLTKAKYICIYSDGYEPYFAKDKIKSTIKNPEETKKEGKERTLLIYEKNNIIK